MIDHVLQRLSELHPKVIDLSLDRVLALLNRLGNPQTHLPPVVHVAGTNGKGSTVATLRALLEAAGLVVHVYTSPHLVRFAERVRIAGQIPDDAAMLALLERVERLNDGQPVTFFEVTTAAAFLAFAETPADVVILETGLGGRLDATNVVDHPALTILTPIAMDHEAFLGDSLAAIAGEKAGILKSGTPCVVASQQPAAMTVIAERAASLSVPLLLADRDFHVRPSADGLNFDGLDLPPPALVGDFQYGNAALALAAVRQLARDGHIAALTPAQMAQGLRSVQWPARLQRLTWGPLVDQLPPNCELWLDGGHNPHAAQALAQQFARWSDRPLRGIFAMLGNKDCDGYLAPLASYFEAMATLAIPGESASLSAEQAAEAARRHQIPAVQAVSDLSSALSFVLYHVSESDARRDVVGALSARELVRAKPRVSEKPARHMRAPVIESDHRENGLASADEPLRILICGSLYLAGHVLAEHG